MSYWLTLLCNTYSIIGVLPSFKLQCVVLEEIVESCCFQYHERFFFNIVSWGGEAADSSKKRNRTDCKENKRDRTDKP